MGVPNPNNMRPHGVNQWISFPYRYNTENTTPQQAGRSVMYANPPLYDNTQFFLGTQQMPTFANNFRGNDVAPIQPTQFLQFTSADLGTMSNILNADDAASLASSQDSCNSKCTSSVCDNENCSVTGVPCDDPTCVESIPLTGMAVLTNQTPTKEASDLALFHQPHGQPCNHTESEHLVARTLGELRAPADVDSQEKIPYAANFDYAFLSRAGEQLYDGSCEPYSSPCQFTAEIESSEFADLQLATQPTCSLPISPSGDDQPQLHICQWITNDKDHQGERTVCGVGFTNTKDFHDHLCEFHIDKMASQTGFACLWAGCSRTQDRPFVTRGKLRRHISTHSVYKPYTCSTCHQGFSGQQALQQHERIHTGDKPFKCTVEGCTMAFKQKSALTMHSRVHTGEKPLQCEYCGKAFPESSNLSKHRKIHLMKSNKYVCDEVVKGGEPCGRSFRRLDQLRRHRETHNKPGKRKANHKRSASAVSVSVSVSGTSGEPIPLFERTPPVPSSVGER
ncbi:hypothetical protein F4802DRAFT_610191 [Xylaria palmicola]|nr:hypothetical protein F4802DRAFT_610191 [Xylaria palmicola]